MYQGSNIHFPGYEMYHEHNMVLHVTVGFDSESQNLKNSFANMDLDNNFVVGVDLDFGNKFVGVGFDSDKTDFVTVEVDFDRVIEVLEFVILPANCHRLGVYLSE